MFAVQSFRIFLLAFLTLLTFACSDAQYANLEKDSSWAPNDHVLYFFDWTDGDRRRQELYSVRLDGSDRQMIIDEDILYYSLSPDGRRIIYTIRDGAQGDHFAVNVKGFVRDLESGEEVLVCTNCGDIEWSPDGSQLAFVEIGQFIQQGNLTIWNASDGSKKQIASASGWIKGWLRDGSRLYYDSFVHGLVVLAPDGEVLEIIPANIKDTYMMQNMGREKMHENQFRRPEPQWGGSISPGGNYNAGVSRGSLYVIAKNQTQRTLLRNVGGFSPDAGMVGFTNLEWTPDEEYIVAEFNGNLVAVEIASGRAGIITTGSRPLIYNEGIRPTQYWHP